MRVASEGEFTSLLKAHAEDGGRLREKTRDVTRHCVHVDLSSTSTQLPVLCIFRDFFSFEVTDHIPFCSLHFSDICKDEKDRGPPLLSRESSSSSGMGSDNEKLSRLNQRSFGVTNRIWLILCLFLPRHIHSLHRPHRPHADIYVL